MPYNIFAPTPGRLGVLPNLLVGRCDAAIGNNTTTTYSFGSHPAKCYINRAVVSAGTVPASTSGTILGVIQKYDASANAAVTLTADVDLEALTAKEGTAVALLSTLTDAERTLDTGDTLQFVVTTNNTVTTAAVDLMVNVELFVEV
jgi:3-oxoacyl-ACP reductase-like protein